MNYYYLILILLLQIITVSTRLYPYKPAPFDDQQGLPDHCGSENIRQFSDCQEQMQQRFSIDEDDLYLQSSKFCCFVWAQHQCEISIAIQCNETIARRVFVNTIRSLSSFCDDVITLDYYQSTWLNKCFLYDINNSNYFLYWSGFGGFVVGITQYTCPQILSYIVNSIVSCFTSCFDRL